MEMMAAIEALRSLREPCAVEFFTDSEYLQNGITTWIKQWKARGWRTVGKAPVKNEDLWRALDQEVARHRVDWKWLKGHAGHADNERCDQLAGTEIAKIKKTHSREQLAAALKEFKEQTAAGSPHTPQLL
jgi:ribonuclease HI